ncbi:hypothetical protein CAI18_01125 [Xanthomonas citri pv. punicae]|nr:hypothetical protein CAI14_20045 [Xanthomonas citri pv. punicae]QCZ70182.1 hypothetical protein CAI17_17680 [Xanthomonas citri pv. punicae]QCZ73299.1 hypothetical protein CAB38_11450 [Xanthomonas citri pv. punicae]QCZ79043.1 hypothetical protein XapA_21990 [Xanthomonas citri pv. punicae]QCZ80059.1 hypothetical protein XapB_02505 [Xanthomonas citri pv. punicae]
MRAIGARALKRPRCWRGPGRGAGVGLRVRSHGVAQLDLMPSVVWSDISARVLTQHKHIVLPSVSPY